MRNLIVFRPGYGSTFYSSIDRLRLGEQVVVLGARAHFTSGEPAALARLSELARARRRLQFGIATASVLGDWSDDVASLTLGDEVRRAKADALRFSPFHRAGGIEPVGPVNALRRLGYAGSQWARPH